MKSIVPISGIAICLLAVGLVIGCDKSPTTGEHIVGPSLAVVGPLAQLAFTVQPITTAAGASIAPAVQVTAQDAQGNTVTTFTGTVTVSIGTGPAGGVLAGATAKAAKAGVATFSNLSIKKSGTYTLVAKTGSQPPSPATSAAFDITPGPAAKLAFAVTMDTAIAGDLISPPVQVTAVDAFANTATSFGGTITIGIKSGPTGGILSGTLSATASNGVVTFADLSLNKVGTYTLSASSAPLPVATTSVLVAPAAPTQLVFVKQPAKSTKAGTTLTATTVTAKDRFGNTAAGFTGAVTIAFAASPIGALLLGDTTVNATLGTATFATLVIQKAGPYKFQARADGLTAGTSNAFTIVPNSPTHLTFTVPPSATAPGAVITPPVEVTVRDAYDNTVLNAGSMTVALGSNPGGGALSGTLTKSANTGAATFADLRINNGGIGYTLVATLGILPTATSASFDISGPATHLVFTGQPSAAAAGATITPAVQVTALDAQGTRATSFTGGVTAAIGSNPGGGTLSGTTTVAAISGVATFSALNIEKAGNGYTLQASSSGITDATSTPFNITAPAVPHLVFTVQPTTTPNAATMNPWVRVSAVDGSGNIVTSFSDVVTLTIGTNPGGGTLYDGSVPAYQGVATFNGIIIDGPGNGYTLVASAPGFASATSAPFDITNFSTRLSNDNGRLRVPQGQPIVPAIQFTAVDQRGITVTSFNGVVTLSLGDNGFGGVLSGTTTLTAAAGVVTFSDVSITKPGTYEVFASSPGVTRGFVSNVEISGPPKYLSFLGNISPTMPGATITPPVQVFAYDSNGTQTRDFVGTVTVAIGTNPGGGTLSGTTSVVADTGVATFSDLSIDKSGSGYTLQASSTGLISTVSPSFDITGSSGTATHLVFSVQPTTTVVGRPITPAVEVTAKDAQENTVAGFVNQISVSNGRCNDPTCDLGGTTDATPVNGVATFADLSIGQTENFSLVASSAGLLVVTSLGFNVTAPDGGDSWTAKARMPTPRAYPAAGVVNGTLYVVGGGNGSLGTLEAYDPATDTWATNLPPMPTPRTGLGVAVINGILYAVGGSSSTGFLGTIEAYDPATNTWETDLPPMPTPRSTLGVAAINGILYAVGGYNGSSMNTLEAYDPVAKTWDATLPPMPTARSSLGVAVINNTLYAIGGDQLSTVEAYDPATRSWTTKASLNTSRDALAVAVDNGIIYALGGGVSGDYGDGAVEAYNLVTNTWSRRAPLLTARAGLTAGVVNGIVYAVGGSQGQSNENEAYQP